MQRERIHSVVSATRAPFAAALAAGAPAVHSDGKIAFNDGLESGIATFVTTQFGSVPQQ